MTIHTQGTIAIAVAAGFALLCFISIGLRMYTQVFITKKFNLNDVGILVALVGSLRCEVILSVN